MREIEAKISELKDAQYDRLTRPCDAFITFEAEDGGIIAQEFEPEFTFSGKKLPAKREFMGDELFLVESTEPTNIIWENRHFTPQDYAKRTTIVLFAIFGLIMVSFVIIFVCKMYAITTSNKYPDVNCDNIKQIYNTSSTSYESYAYREWMGYYQPEQIDFAGEGRQPLSGVLQCFCKDLQSTLGSGTAIMNYESNGKVSTNYPFPICYDYVWDQYLILLVGQAVSYMIVIINVILRLFIIKLIVYIGKDTESEQTRLIANGVFIV